MKRIYPVTEEDCKPHCGKPVLVLMQDGTEIYGVLSRVEGGKLYLGTEEGGAEATVETKAASRARAKANKKLPGRAGRKGKPQTPGAGAVTTSAFPYGPYPYSGGPYYPGGGRFILDLALIALLFVLI
ncbi:hypothetical protein SAMN02799630_04854 [Paenibacillus sp. UNCCL117]|uniref:hypothetical protein n=1 Tax=unclassified Paenibacillus TaxID=185978 RepID=UPI00087E04C8|nr:MULTISPECIES: hypothetical protein [unclassified Paenibacillus]SDE15862.1 hypothetical protein SAMN04488602_12071 [Paenibacillus sp. cl123]SFW61017.1 hypothetical protein SAMN02799630_04854 [Paenibacillus sp. UNCCL117]